MSEFPESLRLQITEEMNQIHNGWTTVERGLEMAQMILDWDFHKSLRCVELGVFGGKSMIPMALALKHKGTGMIYGVDPWMTEPCLEGENEANKEWWSNVDLESIQTGVIKTIWRLGLQSQAIIIRARSQDAWTLFQDGIQFLNIDGCHSEVASCRDAELYVPLVTSGGYIFSDDADWESTQKMQEIILQSCELMKSGENGHYKIFRKL